MSPRATRRLLGGTATGLVLGAGVLGLLAGGGSDTATAGGGTALEERAAALAQFAVFRTAQRGGGGASDPTVVASMRQDGLDPSEAREASLPLGSHAVTVVPSQEALCVYVGVDGGPAAGYGCARWEDALAGRTSVTLSNAPDQAPGEVIVAGVVPEGSGDVVLHGPGGAETLDVHDGVYVADATDPESLSITGPSGATSTIDLGALPTGE